MKVKAVTIQSGDKTTKYIIGASPPKFSEEAKKKLASQKPSKKAAKLMASVAKAKVVVNY
jgi:hypothetical protein